MSVFNSLGSNYNFKSALSPIITGNNKKYSDELKDLLEKKYGGTALLLYKGRHAIQLGLKSLGLPKGSRVGFTGYTCYAVYQSIISAKLEPVYVDISKGSLNFSANELGKTISKNRIKALIIQNTLGYPQDLDEIHKICQKEKIYIVEDLAHCVGSKYKNKREAGTVGDITALSFSQDKMIDGVSGGALVVKNLIHSAASGQEFKIKNSNIAKLDQIQQFRDRFYPLSTLLIRKTYSLGLGKILHLTLKKLNLLSQPMSDSDQIYSLPNWYCRIIKKEFEELGDNLEHRKEISSIYIRNLQAKIIPNEVLKNYKNSSNLRFPIFIENRDELIAYLKQEKIYVSDIWYDSPIAPKKYLKLTKYKGQCKNSEEISGKILNLPTHKNVSPKIAFEVAKKINQWLELQ